MSHHAHVVLGERAIRVMVVEDHDVVRDAVVGQLERAAGIVVCAKESNLGEAEAVAAALVPDVIVIDLHLGDAGCIETARRMRNASPHTKMIWLTGASDHDALVASLLAGASAYLPKQLRGIDLVGTVRRVASGERLLDPSATAEFVDELRHGGGRSTNRAADDRRVLSLVVEGRTDEEIGNALDIDDDAVKGRVSRLVSLTGVVRQASNGAVR